jgi:chemotaxis signal transduction protein
LETENLVSNGQVEEAKRRIQDARSTDLATMLQLFQTFSSMIREARTEIAVVLETGAGKYAVCVDSVVSVERFPEGGIESLPGNSLAQENGLVTSVAKRSKGNELVMILTAGSLLDPALHAGALERIPERFRDAA